MASESFNPFIVKYWANSPNIDIKKIKNKSFLKFVN